MNDDENGAAGNDPALIHAAMSERFTAAEIDVPVAEVHGISAGLLCADASASTDTLLQRLDVGDGMRRAEILELVDALFEYTRDELISEDFRFQPVLPDFDASAGDYARALVHWADGFLFGFGAANGENQLSADATEFIEDLKKLTQADTETNIDDEEQLQAMVEISEYLRAGAILLREERAFGGGEGRPDLTQVLH